MDIDSINKWDQMKGRYFILNQLFWLYDASLMFKAVHILEICYRLNNGGTSLKEIIEKTEIEKKNAFYVAILEKVRMLFTPLRLTLKRGI